MLIRRFADWTTKVLDSLMLLERLADQGSVVLPDKSACGRRTSDKPPPLTSRTAEKRLIKGSLKVVPTIELQIVNDKAQIQLLNEYMERYHPFRYKRPFGNWLLYFLMTDDEPLGCLLMSGATKALHDRDRWIGWDIASRQRKLSWVINNSRYLIFSLDSNFMPGEPCFRSSRSRILR
jgi:hypothetical protein